MNGKHPESPAPAVIPQGLGLTELSDDEFKLLITQGGTVTIGQINQLLGIVTVDASTLATLGITTRQERRAVHMASAGFRALCTKLAAHLSQLAEKHP